MQSETPETTPQPAEVAKPVAEPTVETPKPAPQLKNEATIVWPETAEFQRETQQVLRSYPDLILALNAVLAEKPHYAKRPITIVVDPEDPDNPIRDKDGKPVTYTVASGPADEMLRLLIQRAVHPMRAVIEFQRLSSFMSERSALKGVLVTFVFEDAVTGGFGLVSSITDVTDEDLITLGEAASNQAAKFKDEMRAQRPHLKFPSDEEASRLILPTRFQK